MDLRTLRRGVLLLALLGAGCSWNTAGATGCRLADEPRPLPDGLGESSGVAVSLRTPGLLWTHNDSGNEAVLYAVDTAGRLLRAFPLKGVSARDWEDVAVARCGEGSCLYVADTGDNQEVRKRVFLLRLPEPGLDDGTAGGVEVFPMVFPDGPRDVEALYVLSGERVHLVTKGRSGPVEVYRYPPPLRPGEVTLERVQTLTTSAPALEDQVTGADADPRGRWVVVRTYSELILYRPSGDTLVPVEDGRVDLRTLQEPQGEGVALGPDGRIYLSSESGRFVGPGSLRTLRCPILTRE